MGAWLVPLVLGVHFAYLAYVVLGGFLAWHWAKAIYPHLAVVVWGVLIVLEWVNCPLTAAENWARRLAGYQPMSEGFIDRYINNVIYPERYVDQVRLAVLGVILFSWAGAYLRHRNRTGTRGRARARATR